MPGAFDLAKDLFNTARLKRRDKSTVRRAKMDDGVFDRMREDAELFRKEVERAPELDKTGEGSDSYVPHWDDLVGDVFKSLFTYEEPGVLSADEIKPSREVNRRVMQHLIGSDDFQKARAITRNQEIESAFATMGMSEEVRDSLSEHMAELADEAKEAEKQEQTAERQEEKAEEVREEIRNQEGEVTPEQKEELENAVNRKKNAQGRLEKSMENMQELPVNVGAAQGLAQAAEQGKEDAQLIASLPGIGPGERQKLSPDDALRLAKMFKDNPRLMQVAEMFGRMVRDMRFKRARRITGGREETVDVEMGNETELLLPSEKLLLMDPLTELEFMRRFNEAALLQYSQQGSEEAGFGPLIILRDESGSMNGQRNIWAAAISLALIAIARKEKRDAAVIAFGSTREQEMWKFMHKGQFDPAEMVDMAAHFFNGGTDATPAFVMAQEWTDTLDFNKADIVHISDGHDDYESDDTRVRDSLRARGVRIHGVMIGTDPSEYQREMCDTLVSAYDLAGANEATTALATSIG